MVGLRHRWMRETAGQAAPVLAGAPASVLNVLEVRPGRIAVLKDVPLGNGNWLIELPGGQRAVLRRYHQARLPRVPPRPGRLGTRSRPQDRPVQPDRDRTPAIQDRHAATMTRSGTDRR